MDAYFSAEPSCNDTLYNAYTAPAPCTPSPCAITDLSTGNQSNCLPGVPVYTQQIIVTYNDAPASGTLNVNGQAFGITGSPQTCTLLALDANGADIDVTAFFSDDPACTRTETDMFSAPSGCAPLIWTGNTSTDWHDMTNWSPNEIPTQFNPVTIPSVPTGGVFPVIATGSPFNGNSNNIIIETGASIDVQAGRILFVRGNITTADPVDLGNGIISMIGTGLTFYLSGHITMGKLDIQSCTVEFEGATTNSLSVKEHIQLVFGTLNANNGEVTLLSTAAGTAYLDEFTFSGNYLGEITVQRYVTPGSGLGQRYFGVATNNSSITGLDQTYTGYPLGALVPDNCATGLLTSSSPYSNLMRWNEDGPYPTSCYLEGWEAINDANNLTLGRAYSGWMNDASIISTSGTPVSGPVFYTNLDNSGNGNVETDGWHLLSNPYPTPLEMAAVSNAGFTSPQYYDGASGSFLGTYQPIMPMTNIPIMQGFVAQTAGPNDWSVSNADRSSTYMSEWYSNESWFDYKLEVNVSGNGHADITYVYYNEENTLDFDDFGDCLKRESDYGQPTLYTLFNNENMSLNGMHVSDLGQSIPMGLNPGADGTFELNCSGLESFPSQTTIYIEDLQTGVYHNIENGPLTFAANVLDVEARFVIHFVPAIEVNASPVSCDGSLGIITVDNPDVRTFELNNNGSTISNGTLNTLNEAVAAGNYELTVYDQYGGSQTYSVEVNELETISAAFVLSEMAIEVGNSILLENVTLGSNHSVWNIEGTTLENITELTYTFDEVGVFEIALTVQNDDCNDVKTEQITVFEKTTTDILDVNDFAGIQVRSHNNVIVVDLSNSALEGSTEVEVVNFLGQILAKKLLNAKEIRQIEVNVASDGYYLVKVINKQQSNTYKVLLAK